MHTCTYISKMFLRTFLSTNTEFSLGFGKIGRYGKEKMQISRPRKTRGTRKTRGSVLGRGGLDLIGLGVSIGRGPEGP